MIACYAGTPGSCKTLEAVKRIIANLKLGRRVYTNINGMGDPECQEAIRALSGLEYDDFYKLFHFLEDEKLLRYWENCEEGSFIVIDEVHKLINCRRWNDESNMEFANHASTHRHHGFNILLITQDIQKVDSQVRSLIEWTYFYRKNNFFGSLIKKQFLRYTYTGDQHQGKPLASKTMVMDPRYFHCYKSYTKEAGGEVDFQSHVNVLKHPVFFAIPILLVVTGFMFFKKSTYAKGDVFGTTKAVKVPQKGFSVVSSSRAPLQLVKRSALPSLPPPVPAAAFSSHSSSSYFPSSSVQGAKRSYYTWEDRRGQVHLTNMRKSIPVSASNIKEYDY